MNEAKINAAPVDGESMPSLAPARLKGPRARRPAELLPPQPPNQPRRPRRRRARG
jgi:hypothetical protein